MTNSKIFGEQIHPESIITGSAVQVNGPLTAQTKSFRIPHKSWIGKDLVYGVLEGPEHSVFVRGTLNGGVIYLPEHWRWLVDAATITVQLTPIGGYQKLWVREVKDNKVYVESDNKVRNKRIECYYIVHATRKDVSPLRIVQ